jgi:hypothetical protein
MPDHATTGLDFREEIEDEARTGFARLHREIRLYLALWDIVRSSGPAAEGR